MIPALVLQFLKSNWRFLAVMSTIALLAVFGWTQTHRLASAKQEFKVEREERELERKRNEAARQEIIDRSEKTLGVLNEKIPRMVEQAKKNAVEEYKRQYGVGLRIPVSTGNGLLLNPYSPAETGTPQGAQVDDGAQPTGLPLTRDFLDRASKAAVMIYQCQQFVLLNKLPVEGD